MLHRRTISAITSLALAVSVLMALFPIGVAQAQASDPNANGASENGRISSDGRYVAFASQATNLVPDDTNAVSDVFVRDRQLGVTQRVSVSSSGAQGDLKSDRVAISSNGRYVAFESDASNLVSGDTNAQDDIFVRDLVQGTTTRISVSSSGEQGNNMSEKPAISSDGRYIAFESLATNLVSSDGNGFEDVFVRDTQTGETKRVSTTSSGGEAIGTPGTSRDPAISPDGRYVGFESHADNFGSGDNNDDYDIYVKDHIGGGIFLASRDSGGNEGDNDSNLSVWLSDQANQAAFPSVATNLVPGDTNATSDVFVFDRTRTTIERSSVDSSENQSNGWSDNAGISGDGRYVVYYSDANNLVSGDTNGGSDIFLRDRSAGTTTRVSVDSSGNQAGGGSTRPQISTGGRYVSFESGASLVPGDTNGVKDIFVRDLSANTTSRVSVTSGNRPPSASLTVSPSQGDTTTTFTADMSASYDPDGDSLSYMIDWGDDTTSAGPSASHVYDNPGDYLVVGTVTDALGVTSSAEQWVRVCDAIASGQCVQSSGELPYDACQENDICVRPDPQTGPPSADCIVDCLPTLSGVDYPKHDIYRGDGDNGYRVYVSPGHFSTARNDFPCPPGTDWTEWEEAWESGFELKNKLVSWGYVVMMPKKGRDVGKTDVYRTRVETAYDWWQAEASGDNDFFAYITVHSNSGRSGCRRDPLGTAMLYQDAKDLAVAQKVFNKLAPETPGSGDRERNLGPGYCTDPKFAANTQPNELCLQKAIEMPTAYTEVEWHDNSRGARWLHNNNDVAGQSMAKGIDCYMGKFGASC